MRVTNVSSLVPALPEICQQPSVGLRANPEHLVALGARDHADSIPAGPDGAVSIDVPRPESKRIRVRIARWLCTYGFRQKTSGRLLGGFRSESSGGQSHDSDDEECANHKPNFSS